MKAKRELILKYIEVNKMNACNKEVKGEKKWKEAKRNEKRLITVSNISRSSSISKTTETGSNRT